MSIPLDSVPALDTHTYRQTDRQIWYKKYRALPACAIKSYTQATVVHSDLHVDRLNIIHVNGCAL